MKEVVTMAHIITITGPSMCGKSTVIEQLGIIGRMSKFNGKFEIVKIPKYTTREFRANEIEAVLSKNYAQIDVLPVIGKYNESADLTEEELKQAKLTAFKNLKCDIVYEQYGHRYGIKLEDLYEHLKNGRNPVIILNDVRTIEDLKSALGKQCFSIFIFREIPNIGHFYEEGEKRNDSESSIRARYEKAASIYRIYIENIHLFDKLILNVQKGEESIRNMLEQLVEYLCLVPSAFK